jgi:hypothetical protein
MNTSSIHDGIVADGADRLRKELATRPPSAAATGNGFGRRMMWVVRRLLCLASIPGLTKDGPSPYSVFHSQPKQGRDK